MSAALCDLFLSHARILLSLVSAINRPSTARRSGHLPKQRLCPLRVKHHRLREGAGLLGLLHIPLLPCGGFSLGIIAPLLQIGNGRIGLDAFLRKLPDLFEAIFLPLRLRFKLLGRDAKTN